MCRLFLMTVALLAILFGISGLYMMPKLIQQKIEQRMQLKIGTKNFDRFTRVPIAIKVKFYLFNVTNSEQVMAGLEQPRFQEVGPFMYEQWRRRSVMDIVDNNRKIVYREYKTFYSMWPTSAAGGACNATIEACQEPKMRYLDELEPSREPPPSAQDGSGSAAAQATSSPPPPQPARKFILNPYAHNVTIVNLPLLTVLTKLADMDESSLKRSIAAKIVTRLINEGHEKILITKPVNELLFDGYKVGLMDAASDLISNTLGYNFESPLPRNKFGFFHTKNGTWTRDESGELTIFTGRNESMNDFMMVDNWNGLHSLNVWPRNTEAGNRCNEIRGTDGSQFHPGVTRDHVLDIFSPLICSSIQIKYREDTSCRDIPLLRFTTTADMFAAPKKSLRNACYCTIKQSSRDQLLAAEHAAASWTRAPVHQQQQHPLLQHPMGPGQVAAAASQPARSSPSKGSKITNSRCYIDGLIDLSLCQKGAPIAASGPHFYNGDRMLASAAGLTPRKELHETYMDIEPMTGAVMRAASRAQLNAYVEPAALEVVDPQLIGQMTPMVAPLLWLEESAEIDDKVSHEFKSQLLNTVAKARRTFFGSIALGLILALVVGAQYWYVTCYKIDTSAKAKARRKRKQAALHEDELKSKSAPDRRHRHHRSSGARPSLYQGAKRSNLANLSAQRPLVPLDAVKGARVDPQLERSESMSRAGAAAVAVAAALGAADAAATNSSRRDSRRNRPKRSVASGDVGEDELSRRGLVENEWRPASSSTNQTGSSTASSAGSGPTSCADHQEPTASSSASARLLNDEDTEEHQGGSGSDYSD